jgi:hypothetical protein
MLLCAVSSSSIASLLSSASSAPRASFRDSCITLKSSVVKFPVTPVVVCACACPSKPVGTTSIPARKDDTNRADRITAIGTILPFIL